MPMGKKISFRPPTPLDWGRRFREGSKRKGLNLRQIAERMDLAESTVRSWTNGNRDINLTDFLKLCEAAGLDPAVTLFAGRTDEKFLLVGEAWGKADPTQRGVLWTAAKGILAEYNASRTKGSAF